MYTDMYYVKINNSKGMLKLTKRNDNDYFQKYIDEKYWKFYSWN